MFNQIFNYNKNNDENKTINSLHNHISYLNKIIDNNNNKHTKLNKDYKKLEKNYKKLEEKYKHLKNKLNNNNNNNDNNNNNNNESYCNYLVKIVKNTINNFPTRL